MIGTSMICDQCGKSSDLSARFCSQCGHPLFIDLSRNDLTGEMFLDVLNSLYNLIITTDTPGRDVYCHPASRRLINRRYELEHDLELKAASRGIFSLSSRNSFEDRIEAINMRITSRSSNTLAGYATRGAEELISRRATPPFSLQEIEEGISSFRGTYSEEYLVKDIATHMLDEDQARRILFVFFLQDGNKHMSHFLDEPLLQRWFETIIQTNTETTIRRYQGYLSVTGSNRCLKHEDIAEEVLNDMVFGYCVKLSESLFPVGQYCRENAIEA